jgi:hypothetical protein
MIMTTKNWMTNGNMSRKQSGVEYSSRNYFE